MAETTCTIDGCEWTGVLRRGMCEKHYKSWRRRQADLPPVPSRRNACTVADCDRDADSHGYCRKHADRWKRNGTTDLVQLSQEPTCQVADCGRPSNYASLCSKHYSRKRATGNPEQSLHWPRDLEERLAEFIDYDGPTPRHMPGARPCWVWSGALAKGYGRISAAGEDVWIHRLMYERHVGAIPDGLTIDHLCLNTACCNPAHLEPVTSAENSRRMQEWRARGFFPGGMHARYSADDPAHEATGT